MVVIFGIVFLILAKWGFPVITSSVQKRSDRIADSLRKADEVDRRAERLEEERGQMLLDARKEQSRILKEAGEARDAIISKAKADAQEETARMIAAARMQIEADRLTAEAELRKQVAVLSVEVAEKVLRRKLEASSEQQAFIDALVDEAAKSTDNLQS